MVNKNFFNSQDLIDSVKRRASIPDSQSMITDNEILEFANEEMSLNVVPLIVRQHEDYFLSREDLPTSPTLKEYAIPYRAIGSKLREVAFSTDGESLTEMTRISIDDVTNSYTSSYNSGNRFYLQGENIVLYTTDDVDTGYIVCFFNLRPNSLVLEERVATITAIDRTTGLITVDSVPTNFTSTDEFDFVKKRSPHKIVNYDLTATTVDSGSSSLTFDTDDIPSQLAVGDRVALAGETDLINCPAELHVMLAEMTAARVLESIGDLENLQAANTKIQKMENNASTLLSNRVDGSPIKAYNRNGFLRGRRRR